MTPRELASRVKDLAAEAGFDLCGICAAEPSGFREPFLDWLSQGMHADMGYMSRDPERRLNPDLVLPGAQSLIVVAMNYYTGGDPPEASAPGMARFARYARGDDYHDVMTPRLKKMVEQLRTELDTPFEAKVYVDTGPILERESAQRAGIGWFGKNTLLINTRRGSYFLLGEIITTLAIEPDAPALGGCGTCTKCLEACPTGAIVEPYKVDSRRCISYLTIENKGPIPDEFAGKLGGWVFGCDICQEVCPFNQRRATPTTDSALQPREVSTSSTLSDLSALTEEEFRTAFKGSPVKRAKWQGLRRNAETWHESASGTVCNSSHRTIETQL